MFAESEQVLTVQPLQAYPTEEIQTASEHIMHAINVVRVDSPKIIDSGPTSASSVEKRSGWFGKAATSPGDADSKSSGSSGGSLSSSKSGTKGLASTEFPWHLSVQAAFQVAKIPAPPLERLLPVGFNPPPLSPTVKSLKSGAQGSPEHHSHRLGMVSIGTVFLFQFPCIQ